MSEPVAGPQARAKATKDWAIPFTAPSLEGTSLLLMSIKMEVKLFISPTDLITLRKMR